MAASTDRMLARRWGVFNHFLYSEPDPEGISWNDRAKALDVKRIARDLHEAGAGWYFITVMQGRQYMLAPNRTFDRIAGTLPGEACCERDVILELSEALAEYDIDLYLYFTGDGPYLHDEIGSRFGFTEPRGHVSRDFVEKWASVLEEYAVRYGDRVKGWWLDGMYEGFFGYTQELMELYYRAVKKGNPEALVAFNNGVQPACRKWFEKEELTAGEFNEFTYIPPQRYIDGAQAFMLIPLGISPDPTSEWGRWRQKGARVDHAYLKEYLRKVNEAGGVLTVDIYIGMDGSWDPEQLETIRGL